MKTKIKFNDVDIEEEVELNIQDVEEISEGQDCIIVKNNDDFCFKTHEIRFV